MNALLADQTSAAFAPDALASAYDLVRHCLLVAVSRRLKFMWIVTNEYPFVNQQNPCANVQLLPFTLDTLATVYAIGTAYRHFPYESARRSYIKLATPAWNLTELPWFSFGISAYACNWNAWTPAEKVKFFCVAYCMHIRSTQGFTAVVTFSAANVFPQHFLSQC